METGGTGGTGGTRISLMQKIYLHPTLFTAYNEIAFHAFGRYTMLEFLRAAAAMLGFTALLAAYMGLAISKWVQI